MNEWMKVGMGNFSNCSSETPFFCCSTMNLSGYNFLHGREQLHGRQTSDKFRSRWCIGSAQHGPCSFLCDHVSVSQLRTPAAAFELPAGASVDVGNAHTFRTHFALKTSAVQRSVKWRAVTSVERALRDQMTSCTMCWHCDGQDEFHYREALTSVRLMKFL